MSQMKLGTKLLSGFMAVAFITLILGLLSYRSLSNMKKDIEELAMNRLPSVQAMLTISEAQTAIDGAENTLLYATLKDSEREAVYSKFDAIKKRYEEAWKIYEPLPQTSEEAATWKEFIPAWRAWEKDHETFLQLAKIYAADQAGDTYEKMASQAIVVNAKSFQTAEALLNKIVDINEKLGAETSKTAIDNGNFNIRFILISSLACVVFAITLSLILVKSINKFLTIIGNRLSDASSQVRSASEQLSSAAQQLASGSAEQASSIEETTASLEEMGGMVSNNVDNATRASELSQKVARVSEEGNSTMLRMQESMKEILGSNDKIVALVKVIAAIGEKTKVMDEIVFQTKLLSFNASVEAERAGEHGRGFAVVAQEVGNLAQMSGKAAQEIAQILTESLKQAEVITTENKKKVEIGAHLATETGASLKEILSSANSVSLGANQVLDASKEQASGIKQINIAMSNLEKATQENAALAEEVASTSEELSAQTEMLNSSVLDLDRLINGSNNSNT